tara:strand:+ start:1266 stop:1412 length:147 start_codon:yes stop_codon:yes gene_type:complete
MSKQDTRKYHDWVYMADDQMNKVLKFAVVSIYAYGAYIVAEALIKKFW